MNIFIMNNENVCTLTMNYGPIPNSYLYWPACPHCPTSFLLCGWLREDRLSSSKLPADSLSAETSLLCQTCRVASVMTGHMHHDGRDPGAQAVHLADLQAQTCSFPIRCDAAEPEGSTPLAACPRQFPSGCLNHSTPAF